MTISETAAPLAERAAPEDPAGQGDCHARLRAIFGAFADRPGPAYRHPAGDLSFATLHDAVLALLGQLARLPRSAERRPVLIWGHKDPRYLVAYWACLLAGQALIPIEPETPAARLRQIIETCDPSALLIAEETGAMPEAILALARTARCELLPMPTAGEMAAKARPAVPPKLDLGGGETAYIMFSSGTLGVPKGIQVSYANLIDFVDWLDPLLAPSTGLGPGQGAVTGIIRHCFDVSLFELWTSWTRGLPICALDHGDVADSTGYIRRLAQARAALWVSTPSLTRMFLRNRRFDARQLPDLTTFLFCGEPLTKPICEALFARFPGCRIVNTYGPTECTVAVTSTDITPAMLRAAAELPIGRARSGTRLELAPGTVPGQPGEIRIRGASVGPGYLGLPEKQANAFPRPGLYRSGDRGICDAEGQWHFLGRIDREVKIQGMRVDLNDVEAHLRACEGIEDAVVEPQLIHGEPRALQAFVLGPDDDGALERLARDMAAELPPYLVPRYWYAGFPARLNLNSKLDRKQLTRAAGEARLHHVHMPPARANQREKP